MEFYKFNEIPKVIEKEDFIGSPRKEIERLKASGKDSKVIIEYAVNNYGFLRGDRLTPERKAKEFLWHFETGFEKMFLELVGYRTE